GSEVPSLGGERLLQRADALRAHAVEAGDLALRTLCELRHRADAGMRERPEGRPGQACGKRVGVGMRRVRRHGSKRFAMRAPYHMPMPSPTKLRMKLRKRPPGVPRNQ